MALAFILMLCISACGNSKTKDIEVVKHEPTENMTNKDGSTKEDMHAINLGITDAQDFSNGYAWIEYENNDVKYHSIVDTSGVIRYTTSEKIQTHTIQKSTCYINVQDNGNYISRIIDLSGNAISSSESGLYDVIGACGDDMYFVYKEVSSIDSNKKYVGVIDSNGKLLNELHEFVFDSVQFGKQLDKATFISHSFHLGAGIFAIWYSRYNAEDLILYSAYSNRMVEVDGVHLSTINRYSSSCAEQANMSIGNKAYLLSSSYWMGSRTTIQYDNDLGNEVSHGSYISIDKNLNVEDTHAFTAVMENTLIKLDDNQLETINPDNGSVSRFKQYPVAGAYRADDKILLQINGQDGKCYAILIDELCNMVGEPFVISDGTYIEYLIPGSQRIVCNTTVYDYSGKKVFELDGYHNWNGFHDGVLWEKNKRDSNYYGFGLDGNIIMS